MYKWLCKEKILDHKNYKKSFIEDILSSFSFKILLSTLSNNDKINVEISHKTKKEVIINDRCFNYVNEDILESILLIQDLK